MLLKTTVEKYDRPETCLGFNLRRTSRVVSQHYEHWLKPSGLKMTQFSLLNAIQSIQQPTIMHLADRIDMDRTTLTRNLKPLIRDELVQTIIGQDQRCRKVELTTKGKNKLSEANLLWKKAQQALASQIPQQQLKELFASLLMVRNITEKARDH